MVRWAVTGEHWTPERHGNLVRFSHLEPHRTCSNTHCLARETAYLTQALSLRFPSLGYKLCSSLTLEKDLLSSSSKRRVPGPGAILKGVGTV